MPSSSDRGEHEDRSSRDPLWQAATALVEKTQQAVDADVRERTGVRALWTQALKAMREGRVDAMARLLDDHRLATSTELYPQIAGNVRNVKLAVQRALESQTAAVLGAVEAFAAERGWRSHRSPDRVTLDGLVAVTIGTDGSVKVQARVVRTLDPIEVLRVLEAEHDRVWKRARGNVDQFAEELAEILGESQREADPQGYVRLQGIYNRLKGRRPKERGRLVSYYRDEFSADLSSISQHPAYRRRFQLSAARDPNLAFPVVLDDGTLNQYGYVRLRVEGG